MFDASRESLVYSKGLIDGMGCTMSCSSDVGVNLVLDGFIREAQALMVSDAHVPQLLLDLQQRCFLSMTHALSQHMECRPDCKQSLSCDAWDVQWVSAF